YVSGSILKSPTVAVTVAARRQRVCSVLGAVTAPGTYQIDRNDMRLLNILAAARGITQQNIKYLYVIRPEPAKVMNPKTGKGDKDKAVIPTAVSRPATPSTTDKKIPAPVKPKTEDNNDALRELGNLITDPPDVDKGQPATKPDSETPAPVVVPTFSETSSVATTASTSAEAEPQVDRKSEKWVYVDGKWIKTVQKAEVATQPSGKGTPAVKPVRVVPTPKTQPVVSVPRGRKDTYEDPYGWKDADKSSLARVIFIDIRRLQQGDARLNIVIRDNDVIRVPPLEPGEFYIMGEVSRPGVYTLTGRRVTVKMALAAAGNLNALAWPENCSLVRRIGENQEQTVALNLRAIMSGKEPDQFLKPNDVLEVGTHWKTSFLAVVRNAFRVSYGVGMIYDRNFGAATIPGYNMDSWRFKRW
ncbi:MAG: hypothetical protein GY794_25035, partial [bacterium]|nr:hypothetical protein [bacterium]